ncbi:MAG TPA: DUF4388 domain-containing protein [Trueperaceae bacterium]|nr:DUF4388 domain-containing protein [Trueperaceae bacterium]
MTTLHGRLEEGVLANLLQYLALSQASGCLLLRHPQSRQGSIYLERGKIVFVEAKPSYDIAALAALLRWREGQFSFRPGVRSPRITLERSTAMLLLEASHLADEANEERAAGPQIDADTVLSALAERPTVRQHDEGPGPGPGQVRGERGQSGRGGQRAEPYAVLLPSSKSVSDGQSVPGASSGGTAAVGATRGVLPKPSNQATNDETVALSLSALLLYRRLDGHLSLRHHATELNREADEMVRAGRELLEARLAEYVTLVVADPRFVVELAREAVDLLGPVGEIVVEDALYDMGLSGDTLPVNSVDELIRELSSAFKNAFTRADFLRRVTELRRLFALEPTEPGRTR